MNNKAVICFCVDGLSEIKAFQTQFCDLFDQKFGNDVEVIFRIAKDRKGESKGDITSLIDENSSDEIEIKIYKYYFRNQDKSSDIQWNDITSIIHIIDLDGAFIKDKDILEFSDEEAVYADNLSTKYKEKNILYYPDHIAVRPQSQESLKVESIVKRNMMKRQKIENLHKLNNVLKIHKKAVNYYLYYFSSNLDHFLYGEANLCDSYKTKKANEFNEKYLESSSFVEFFEKSDFSTKQTYMGSWEEIKKKNNSLTRGTNVNLLIKKIIESKLEDWL